MTISERKVELLNLARTAQQNAYAPYSKFRVGAAVLLENGEIFTGCNVENASYGLTNCAERSAIFSAVSKLGGANVKIRAVAVVNDHDAPCSPCGACRQVIAEFGPEAIIWYQGRDDIRQSTVEHRCRIVFGCELASNQQSALSPRSVPVLG